MKRYYYILIIIWTVLIDMSLHAQIQESFDEQKLFINKSTGNVINTFESYNQKIIGDDRFRFRKAIRKARQENFILEYISDNERILISKLDYLKMLKRTINHSGSAEVFIEKMQEFFPSKNNQVLQGINLEVLYDQGRKLTLNGFIAEINYLK